MSDEEAVHRLQSVMIAACEGNQDLAHGREYKAIRGPLIGRADLADVVPKFVRSERNLASFWAYIRGIDRQWEARRTHVWEAFRPLFDRVEGRTPALAPSSAWTGRRSAAQQARIVLALAPDALLGVELLLDDQERALHNGGPADDERLEAMRLLRALHSELGELLRLAENGLSVSGQLRRVKAARDGVLGWSRESLQFAVAGTPLMAASTLLGCGVYMLIGAITKGSGDAATLGGAAMAVHATGALLKKRVAA